jgi:pimeloyl-ACP methyl ester carboxylesterase
MQTTTTIMKAWTADRCRMLATSAVVRTDRRRWQRRPRRMAISSRRMPPDLLTPERLSRGHIFVLPGIEGESRWNHRIVRGLVNGGVDCGIEIHDWTYGRWLSLYSLRAARRHASESARIADKIATTRQNYPEAPVWLIGHSGGGAMSVLTLERLAGDVRAEGAILLGPALSPRYPLEAALRATRRGIWSFSSKLDAFFLMFGTLVMGTLDGRHRVSAGAVGFHSQPDSATADNDRTSSAARLTEIPWSPRMARDGNLGGHFGYVHPTYVERWLVPIIQRPESPPEHLRQAMRRPPQPDHPRQESQPLPPSPLPPQPHQTPPE